MQGPLGEFFIPEEPPETHGHVLLLSQQVFDGEYDHPELPKDAVSQIIDIGCGWGAFTVWAKAKWPIARIIGYDPHAEALRYFSANAPWANGMNYAVTIDPAPYYGVSWEWGSGHTRGRTDGVIVPSVHPEALPPCDILKIDAEGVEPEILRYYSHMRQLKAIIYEYHSPSDAVELRAICEAHHLHNLRHDTADYGTAIWVPAN